MSVVIEGDKKKGNDELNEVLIEISIESRKKLDDMPGSNDSEKIITLLTDYNASTVIQ